LCILQDYRNDNLFHKLVKKRRIDLLTATLEKMEAAGKSFNQGNFAIAFNQGGYDYMRFLHTMIHCRRPRATKDELNVVEKILATTKLTTDFYAGGIIVSLGDLLTWHLASDSSGRTEIAQIKNILILLLNNLSPQQFKTMFTLSLFADDYMDKTLDELYYILNTFDYIPYLFTDPIKIFETRTSTDTHMKFDADKISHQYEKFLLKPALGLVEHEEEFLNFYSTVVAHQITLRSGLNREYITLMKKAIENLPRTHNAVKDINRLLAEMENAFSAVPGSEIELTESHYGLSHQPVNIEEIKKEIREQWNSHLAKFKQYIDERREAIGTTFWNSRNHDFVVRENYYKLVSKEGFLENPTSLRKITSATEDDELGQGTSKKCLSFLWLLKKDLMKWDALLNEQRPGPVLIRMS
jgi:hypothetical protein